MVRNPVVILVELEADATTSRWNLIFMILGDALVSVSE